MQEHDMTLFLAQISTMLLMALLCGRLARKLGYLAVFGELVGGILLGPTVFGWIAPGAFDWLFPASGAATTGRQALVKLGLIFFLLVAGMEVEMSALRRRGACLVLVSVLGIVVPFALGYATVVCMPGLFGCGEQVSPSFMALFMGTALSISALPVIARVLMDIGLIRHELGVIIMGSAMINDLIGWFLFGLILANVPAAAGGESVRGLHMGCLVVPALFALFLTVGRWLGGRLVSWLRTHTPWPSGFIGMSALLVLITATLFELLGSHATIGAFLVGTALAPGFKDRDEERATVTQFVTGFFGAPLYFVSVGLGANFVKEFDVALVVVVLLVACLGKIGGAGLGAWLGRAGGREALAIGFGMNARGVIEIILASIAMENGIIGQRLFVALVIMALVTSLASGPVMQRLLRAKIEQTPVL